MSHAEPAYRGRFAPSPTGPLHMGSLIAALASYLDARHQHGQWLVRMEDIDPPRESPGAASAILASLVRHGLVADGDIMFQHTRSQAYDGAIAQLASEGLLFNCQCTRQMLGPNGACAGRCDGSPPADGRPSAHRVRVSASTNVGFDDLVQGPRQCNLVRDLPDFTVRRKDSLYAYQLAVAVDDLAQGITHVIRGSDLLESTPRQIYLMHCLGSEAPIYGHIPVITGSDGQKLSKQTHAAPLDDLRAEENLRAALMFLHQPTPPESLTSTSAILAYAIEHWSMALIPRVMKLPSR